MSSSDVNYRKIKVDEELRVDSNKKTIYRDDAIYIYSDADGYIRIVADVGIKLDGITTMQTGKQLNASADGVVTKALTGTVSDSDFTTDTNGLIAVTSGRIYFRYNGGWHYIDQTA